MEEGSLSLTALLQEHYVLLALRDLFLQQLPVCVSEFVCVCVCVSVVHLVKVSIYLRCWTVESMSVSDTFSTIDPLPLLNTEL